MLLTLIDSMILVTNELGAPIASQLHSPSQTPHIGRAKVSRLPQEELAKTNIGDGRGAYITLIGFPTSSISSWGDQLSTAMAQMTSKSTRSYAVQRRFLQMLWLKPQVLTSWLSSCVDSMFAQVVFDKFI